MTHHAPHQDCPDCPPRLPRHAAVVPAASRWQLHAALRLFIAAGSCVAGLCLVIGLIAVVTSASAAVHRRHPAKVTTEANSAPRDQPGLQGLASVGPATVRFTTQPGSSWRLTWAFRCPRRGGHRYFAIRASSAGLQLARSGRHGRGITRAYRSSGPHLLAVRSGCGWRVRVLQNR